MDLITYGFISIIVIMIIFLALTLICKKCESRLKSHYDENIEMEHYLPKEEVKNIRQVGYLFIIFLCIVLMAFISCNLGIFEHYEIFIDGRYDLVMFYGIDILLSLYLALSIDLRKDIKNKILFILLVPYGSVYFFSLLITAMMPSIPSVLLLEGALSMLADALHLLALLYFIRIYYIKFLDYTKDSPMGRTMLLFFSLLVVTFIITILTEHVTILESINMVSNAFASNGYVVSGTTIIGEINETIIVWGGYILSTVGTATLTAAILIKHFESKFKHYGDMNKRFDHLKEMLEDDEN